MNLVVGQKARRSHTLTAEHVQTYAALTGDYNPLHFDAAFAHRTKFGRLVVQGGLTTGLLHALVAMDLPGPGTVFLSQNWKFTAPVYLGDTITAEAEVVSVHPNVVVRDPGRVDDAPHHEGGGADLVAGVTVPLEQLADRSLGRARDDAQQPFLHAPRRRAGRAHDGMIRLAGGGHRRIAQLDDAAVERARRARRARQQDSGGPPRLDAKPDGRGRRFHPVKMDLAPLLFQT